MAGNDEQPGLGPPLPALVYREQILAGWGEGRGKRPSEKLTASPRRRQLQKWMRGSPAA